MPEYNKEDFKAECDRRRNENLIVKGKTFDIKDDIKGMGGIWDSKEKQWLMPDEGAVAECNSLMGLGDGPPVDMRRPQEREEPPIDPNIDPNKVPF